MTAHSAAPESAAPGHYAHKWNILAAVGLALFLSTVDSSIVNVALPTFMRELNADFPTIQWVVLSYLLGLTVLMISMGRLADLIGKKVVFMTGLVVFIVGSALCGLAPDVYWLIGFRVVQSIGAAMIMALGIAIVTETWPPEERGKAIGTTGGVIAFGIVFGPTVGGFILEFLSWRWIFYVNVPIGLVVVYLVLRYVPALKPARTAETFDVAGALITGVGLLAFSLGLTLSQDLGFESPLVLGLLAIFALAIVAFVWVERRVQYPMIDLSLFRNPQFSLNLFTGWLTFVAIAGIVFLLPFYLDLVLGLPLRWVGIMMAIVPIIMGVLQPFTGALSDKLGTRPVTVTGLAIMVIGYLSMSTLRVDGTSLGFVLRTAPIALGSAIFQSPNNSAIMGSVPRHRLGVASGILSMIRTLGQVTGIALLGTFFNARLRAHAGGVVELEEAAPAVITAALHDQFRTVAAIVFVGLVVAALTWRRERAAARAAKLEPQVASE